MTQSEIITIAEQERREEDGIWQRWRLGWSLLFYATLLLGLVVALPRVADGVTEAILILALTGAFAFWYSYMGGVRKVWTQGTARAAGFLAVETGLWFSLILLDPVFVFAGIALLAHVCSLTLEWSIAVALIFGTGLLLDEALAPGPLEPVLLITGMFSAAVVVLLNYLFHNISRRSEERRRLISQLEATRTELAAAEREAGMLAERHRLARDIHDTLAQGFTSIVMLMEVAEAELETDPQKALTSIDQARSTARESLAEARSLVWALRSDRLVGASLIEALQSVIDHLNSETATQCELVVTGTMRQLPSASEECLLRVTQEALANVRRHANASKVTVTISYLDDVVALDVRDDGVGFDPAFLAGDGVEPDGGLGLHLMLERVEQIGGTRVIESSAGDGTSVVVHLPTEPSRAAEVS